MGVFQQLADFVTMRNHASTRRVETMSTRAAISGQLPSYVTGRPQWPRDNVIVMTREGYYKAVTAFACINILADAVAEATLRVWEDQGSGKKSDIPDHPLRHLLQHPNQDMSEAEFIAHIVRTSALGGFTLMEKIRSSHGNVVAIGFVRNDWAQPVPRDQAPPDWMVNIPGYKPQILKAEDAIVYRYLDSPTLDPTGDTPMRAILREIGISNDLTSAVKLMLERGGSPQVLLVVDTPTNGEFQEPLTDEDREVIRQQWISKYGGVSAWGGPAIVEGMRVEQVSFDMNQMGFKDLSSSIDMRVCQAFRVPHVVAQVMAGVSSSYGKLLEESMTMLQMYTARPIRTRLDGALTRGLLPEFDTRPNIDLGFDESDVPALQEDEDAIHSRIRADFDAGGLTWDEFRSHIGEEPWGNELGKAIKIPYNILPTPTDTKVLSPAPVGATSSSVAAVIEAGSETERFERRGDRLHLSAAYRAQADQGHKNLIRACAGRIAGDLKTFFEQQRARVLAEMVPTADLGRSSTLVELVAHARSSPGSLDYRAFDPIDWEMERSELEDVLRWWWEVAAEEGAIEAATLLGIDADWDGNQYLQQLRDVLAQRVKGITETTTRKIEQLVIDGLTAGNTDVEIGTKISDLFDITYANRHVTIAHTEAMHAVNLGAQIQYAKSPHIDEVEMRDNPQCNHTRGSDGLTCSERNGMVIPVTSMSKHSAGEHPNGSLGFLPILNKPLGEV